jgi:hypothetical protein
VSKLAGLRNAFGGFRQELEFPQDSILREFVGFDVQSGRIALDALYALKHVSQIESITIARRTINQRAIASA